MVITGLSQIRANQDEEWLHRGLEAEKAGNYEETLNIWLESRIRLETPSTAIATEFIRLATEHGLQNYYEPAHSMYMWGLSAEKIKPNADALEHELERLQPIVHPNLFKQWQQLLETEDPMLYEEIRKFWERKNYLPDPRYNPRLLEHWERIAYAKRNFKKEGDSTSVPDSRISHYVRFGEPDREIFIDLATKPGEVADFIVLRMIARYGGPPSRYYGLAETISNEISFYEKNTELNIWVYGAQKMNTKHNLILIFEKWRIVAIKE